MKVSLDIHGVIDTKPVFFSELSKAIINSGGEVHILTGGSLTKDLIKELIKYKIEWTHIFSVYDYLIAIDTPRNGSVEFTDGTFQEKFEDGYWDKVKGEYCLEHDIDLHIDDTLVYNNHFKTPFASFHANEDTIRSQRIK